MRKKLAFQERSKTRAIKKIASNGLARKKAISFLVGVKTGLFNIKAERPQYTSDEMLSWRSTMRLKKCFAGEVYQGNNYGAGLALRTFSGMEKPIKACMEHGIYFGDYVNPAEAEGSGFPALITYGTERAKRIRAYSNIPILTVGPYIAYANNYLCQKELSIAKAKLGRVLLTFPCHSTRDTASSFNVDDFISEIQHQKRTFDIDSVLVSIRDHDLLMGRADAYEAAGFTVVTCGTSTDANFLRRLRSLITIADVTSSNGAGTHIGYCTYFGKPHILFNQDLRFVSRNQSHGRTSAGESNGQESEAMPAKRPIVFDSDEKTKSYLKTLDADRTELAAVFSTYSKAPTVDQLRVCEKFWGFDCVRSAEHLRKCFAMFENAFALGDWTSDETIRKFFEDMTACSLKSGSGISHGC